ncbi:hypothetical protein SDC9_197754 [bioreactor metagenome]|uniref:Uncharacterized protein n=1 Tax=bioreactor metagenome TaxID=1076179 RepID=A0A645IFP8_9ZZZZ
MAAICRESVPGELFYPERGNHTEHLRINAQRDDFTTDEQPDSTNGTLPKYLSRDQAVPDKYFERPTGIHQRFLPEGGRTGSFPLRIEKQSGEQGAGIGWWELECKRTGGSGIQ